MDLLQPCNLPHSSNCCDCSHLPGPVRTTHSGTHHWKILKHVDPSSMQLPAGTTDSMPPKARALTGWLELANAALLFGPAVMKWLSAAYRLLHKLACAKILASAELQIGLHQTDLAMKVPSIFSADDSHIYTHRLTAPLHREHLTAGKRHASSVGCWLGPTF